MTPAKRDGHSLGGGARAVAEAGTAEDLAALGPTPEEVVAEWNENKPEVAGAVANSVVAVVLACIGAAGIFLSIEMGIGVPSAPAPGMWPLIISVVLLVLSISLGVFGRHDPDAEKFSTASWQVVIGTGTLVGFALLVGTIGFEIPALLLMFIWLKFMGKESWRMSIVLSFAVVAAFYLIFVVALSVPIPHLF